MTQDSDPKATTFSFYENNAKEFFKDTVDVNMTVLYAPKNFANQWMAEWKVFI